MRINLETKYNINDHIETNYEDKENQLCRVSQIVVGGPEGEQYYYVLEILFALTPERTISADNPHKGKFWTANEGEIFGVHTPDDSKVVEN